MNQFACGKRHIVLGQLVILVNVFLILGSCRQYQTKGNEGVTTFNKCSLSLPKEWNYKVSKSNDNDDVIWLYKDKTSMPWIDIVITNDKPERDLGTEITYTGKNNLINMISQDPENNYSVGGSGSDITLWNRAGIVADFTITDNNKKEEDFKYLYFGSRIKKINKVVFIGIVMHKNDEDEISKILDSLRINGE